jgi:protein-disulfide isomerase
VYFAKATTMQKTPTSSSKRENFTMESEKTAFSRVQQILFLILLSILAQVTLSIILLIRLNQVVLMVSGTNSPTIANALGQPVRLENVSVKEAPIRGDVDAPVTIVMFSDFECGYCASHQVVLRQIETKFAGKVRVAYRHFPRQANPQTFASAAGGVCAQNQGKFWEMHDLLFSRQNATEPQSIMALAQEIGLDLASFEACLSDDATQARLEMDVNDGRLYGVEGTPTYFVNGRLIQGAVVYEEFEKIVQQELPRIK